MELTLVAFVFSALLSLYLLDGVIFKKRKFGFFSHAWLWGMSCTLLMLILEVLGLPFYGSDPQGYLTNAIVMFLLFFLLSCLLDFLWKRIFQKKK